MSSGTASLIPLVTSDPLMASRSASESDGQQDSSAGTYFFDANGRLIVDDRIRLLQIQPGNPEDTIRADISMSRLSESPIYEALSYTWGSLEHQQQIEIIEQSPGKRIVVRL